MEFIEWNYVYIIELVEFVNDKEIVNNFCDNFFYFYRE